MEKFTVDLDKVLDEFEENEDQQDKVLCDIWKSQKLQGLQHGKNINSSGIFERKSVLNIPSRDQKPTNCRLPKNYCRAEYADKFDLTEADFATSLKTSTLNPSSPVDEIKSLKNHTSLTSVDQNLLLLDSFDYMEHNAKNTVTKKNDPHNTSPKCSKTDQQIVPSHFNSSTGSKPEYLQNVSTFPSNILPTPHSQNAESIKYPLISACHSNMIKTHQLHKILRKAPSETTIGNWTCLSGSAFGKPTNLEDHSLLNSDCASRLQVGNNKEGIINGYSKEEDQEVISVSLPAETSNVLNTKDTQDVKYEINLHSSDQMLNTFSKNDVNTSSTAVVNCYSFSPSSNIKTEDKGDEMDDSFFYSGVSESVKGQINTNDECMNSELCSSCKNSHIPSSVDNKEFCLAQITVTPDSNDIYLNETRYDFQTSEGHAKSSDVSLIAETNSTLLKDEEETKSNDPVVTEQTEGGFHSLHDSSKEQDTESIDIRSFQNISNPTNLEYSRHIFEGGVSDIQRKCINNELKSHITAESNQNNHGNTLQNHEVKNDTQSQHELFCNNKDLSYNNSFLPETQLPNIIDTYSNLSLLSDKPRCEAQVKEGFSNLSDEDLSEAEIEHYLSNVTLENSEKNVNSNIEETFNTEESQLKEVNEVDSLYTSDSDSLAKEENEISLSIKSEIISQHNYSVDKNFSSYEKLVTNSCTKNSNETYCSTEESTMNNCYITNCDVNNHSVNKSIMNGHCGKESTDKDWSIEKSVVKEEKRELCMPDAVNTEGNDSKLVAESYNTSDSVHEEKNINNDMCEVTQNVFSLNCNSCNEIKSETVSPVKQTSDSTVLLDDGETFSKNKNILLTPEHCLSSCDITNTELKDASDRLKSPDDCNASVPLSTNTSQGTGEVIQPKVQRPTFLNLPLRAPIIPKSVLPISSDSDETPSPEHQQDISVTNEICAVETGESTSPYSGSSHVVDLIYEERSSLENVCARLSEEEQMLGKIKPFWIPDIDAASCMHCETRFTMIKRRHHCRACGKVLCAHCCNQKTRLIYLDNKEARVCHNCLAVLNKVQAVERLTGSSVPASPNPGASNSTVSPLYSGSSSAPTSPGFLPCESSIEGQTKKQPDPNNPQEYCSTVSPLQQDNGSLNRSPLTVLVPIGVLKRAGEKPRREPKQVMFSDGIRPGGELTDLDNSSDYHSIPVRRHGRVQMKVTGESGPETGGNSIVAAGRRKRGSRRTMQRRRVVISDNDGPLPPILLHADFNIDGKPDTNQLLKWMQDNTARPIMFGLTRNLHVLCKLVTLECCCGKECWCFTSRGMCSVGQDEIVVILEKHSSDQTVPKDIFRLFTTIYDNASSGTTVSDLGHVLFPEGILGSRDHSGFLFVRPTFQCLGKLVLPSPPFLVAVLIQKWEVPWAKVFPLRLMLRLGYEYCCYPCPLISIRFRKSVYGEVGNTIMNVLADFRNYQYKLSTVPGMHAEIKDKKTCIYIPQNHYDQMMKVLNNNNENVLAMASTFSKEAVSHLVCVQNTDGIYQTQTINIQNVTQKRTGVSFIVFTGALKASSKVTAKSAVVEDGLLIQIPSETLMTLRTALREMRDFTVACGPVDASEPDEVVSLEWTKDNKDCNLGVKSPVDGKDLDGVHSVRIHLGTDYAGERYLIRWTEVFLIKNDNDSSIKRSDTVDPVRLAESISQSFCLALTPHLELLADEELTKIGLRVTLNSEQVGYEVGAQEEALPNAYMNDLDSALIPVISSFSCQEGHLCLELIFHILLK
ncbi:uncharacterized protein LOC143245084 isoform X2 [Tachypleus tridentatus]|uniref:uncharacterized protein LOC143245084 isoform X2 n=1 Tax=Tachypleus tridentatus TaxID=6853 RepID=UPI003FCF416B